MEPIIFKYGGNNDTVSYDPATGLFSIGGYNQPITFTRENAPSAGAYAGVVGAFDALQSGKTGTVGLDGRFTPTNNPNLVNVAPITPVTPQATPTPVTTPTPTPTPNTPNPTPAPQPNPTVPVTPQTPTPTTPTPSTPTPTNPTTPNTPTTPSATAQADQVLEQYLSSSALPEDQKAIIRTIYQATGSNDVETVERLKSAMAAAKEYNQPYFKAQLNLALDALDRGISSNETDLGYRESSLQNTLNDLRNDIASSKDYLTFQQSQELKDLERNYGVQLENTQDSMAATGFTNSSRRVKTEGLLRDQYDGIVQSTNRGYMEKSNALTNQLTRNERNTAADLSYYQDKNTQSNIGMLRQAENQLGTTNLQNAGYSNLLGTPVGGELPRQEFNSNMQFANSFIF